MAEIETTYRIAGEGHQTLSDYLLYRRHLYAYEQAIKRLPPQCVVADIGCGYGYALKMLSEKASKVYAIDAADTALDSLPELPNLEKIKAYADSIPLPNESVDFIIAFQLLEHLPPQTAGTTLSEFLRTLRPSGTIVATTPNSRWRLFEGQPPWNPYHTMEYSSAGLEALCKQVVPNQFKVKSVVGLGIAQPIEIARVSPSPLSFYGKNLKSYAQRLWQYYGPKQVARWRRIGRKPVQPQQRSSDWFTLSDDASAGLDLWLEVNKS